MRLSLDPAWEMDEWVAGSGYFASTLIPTSPLRMGASWCCQQYRLPASAGRVQRLPPVVRAAQRDLTASLPSV